MVARKILCRPCHVIGDLVDELQPETGKSRSMVEIEVVNWALIFRESSTFGNFDLLVGSITQLRCAELTYYV